MLVTVVTFLRKKMDKSNLPLNIRLAIVKGVVTDYALSTMSLNELTTSALSRILREIADELDKG